MIQQLLVVATRCFFLSGVVHIPVERRIFDGMFGVVTMSCLVIGVVYMAVKLRQKGVFLMEREKATHDDGLITNLH